MNTQVQQNQVQRLDVKKHQIHSFIPLNGLIYQRKFLFVPNIPIQKQIEEFESLREANQWNGEVVLLGFKGAMKPEQWALIEESLRPVTKLTKLTFVDIKLDVERLLLLSSLIQLIEPDELSLKFKQNGIDDHGLQAFMNEGLMKYLGRKIISLLVVSNPGIFKGSYLKKFKHDLTKIYEGNKKYNLHFIKNKEYKSIGFIRIPQNTPKTDELEQINRMSLSLEETYFFQLSLQKCFTSESDRHEAVQNLIELNYHVDKLEKLESLNLNECHLGDEQVFQKICQKISESNGLLSLGLFDQKHFQNSQIVQSLMGDRCNQLRLNHFEFEITRDNMKGGFLEILKSNLISKSIKSLSFGRAIEDDFKPDFQDILLLTEVFKNLKDAYNKTMKKENYIPRMTLKSLDLCRAVEKDLQRIDLDYAFISALIFNEFCSIKKLKIQPLNESIVNAYLKAIDEFENHIKQMKQSNSLYVNFMPALNHIKVDDIFDLFKLDFEQVEQLYRRFFFTKSTDLFKIKKISLPFNCLMDGNLGTHNRPYQFLKSLDGIYKKDPNIQYTLQDLKLLQTGDGYEVVSLLFQNIVFSNSFKIMSFKIIGHDQIENTEGEDYIDWISKFKLSEEMLNKIPLGQQWSLRILAIKNVRGYIDLYKLVELLVFSNKIQLEELILMDLNPSADETSQLSLKQKATSSTNPLSIRKLHFGYFGEFKSYKKYLYSRPLLGKDFPEFTQTLVEVIVNNPNIELTELLLCKYQLLEYLTTTFQKQILEQNKNGFYPLNKLQSIIVEGYEYEKCEKETEEQWELFADIFIYGEKTFIQSIEFRNILITSVISKGLKKSRSKKLELNKHNNFQDEAPNFSLNTLIFLKCKFEDELLSLLFTTSIQKKKNQVLRFINCENLNDVIKYFKKSCYANQLRRLELIGIENMQIKNQMSQFAKIYISNPKINLECLIMSSEYGKYKKNSKTWFNKSQFLQILPDCIEQSMQRGKVCNLKILKLKGIPERLNVRQTQRFFKTVFFNKQVPLQVVEIDQIDFESDKFLYDSLYDQLVRQNYKCQLSEISINTEDEKTILTFQRLLPIFIKGDLVKLYKFSFTGSKLSFAKFSNKQELLNFSITQLVLEFSQLRFKDFKFLYYARQQNLKILQISAKSDLLIKKKFKRFLNIEQYSTRQSKVTNSPTSLLLNLEYDEKQKCIEFVKNFVFSKGFLWNDVTIKTSKKIYFLLREWQLQGLSLLNNLRQLKIDSFFHSGYQVIGQQLIYEERSTLEELCLIDCDFKDSDIQALTQDAQVLRDKIKLNNKQQTTNLSLKRFNINNTLKLNNEAKNMISNNIIFFEYITIEKVELQLTQQNNDTLIEQCLYAQDWLIFQKNHKRGNYFGLKYADWGRNEAVQSKKVWDLLCDTFIFSDNTPQMEVLNIHGMSLKDEQIQYISSKADNYFSSKPLGYISPLRRLNFSLNSALSEKGWKQISERFIFSKHVNLVELDLTATMIDSPEKLDAISLSAIKKAAQMKDNILPLHTLVIENIALDQIIFKVMRPQPTINQITDCQISFKNKYDSEDDQKLQMNGLIYKNEFKSQDGQEPQFRWDSEDEQNQDGEEIQHQLEFREKQNFQNTENTEISNSSGKFTSVLNYNLYQQQIVKVDVWGKESKTKFSQYHLEIIELLRPLSKLFKKNKFFKGHFPVDLSTCDELCTIFKYNQNQGDPYPYQLFFSNNAFQFFQNPQCQIHIINFIQNKNINAENVNQFQVLRLWEHLKQSKSSLDVIYMDYRFDDDLVEAMLKKGYNERDIVNLVRIFPPSSIVIIKSLTLQALKGIYTIMCDNYQFNDAQILYDKNNSFNVGIGFSLREQVYKSNPTGRVAHLFRTIFYNFFNLFVTPIQKYSFSEQIKEVNEYLSDQGNYIATLIFLTLIYFVICIFGPYVSQHYYGVADKDVCEKGISNVGLYTYLVFAFFSFIAEANLYIKITQKIPNHVQGLVELQELHYSKKNKVSPSREPLKILDEQQQPLNEQQPFDEESINLQDLSQYQAEGSEIHDGQNYNKSQSQQIPKSRFQLIKAKASQKFNTYALTQNGLLLSHTIDLILAQLAKLNFYTDVSFIVLTYYCKFPYVALFALISTGFNTSLQLYELIQFIVSRSLLHKNQKKLLSTKYINDFYEISLIGRNFALATILDAVAPYNVTVIPNNFITKALLPSYAGKSMSSSVRGYIVKFIFGDLPHFILQLYFIIYVAYQKQQSDSVGPILLLTVLNTARGIIVSFMKLMSIRPSSLSQADFDDLAKIHKKDFLTKQLEYLDQEQRIFQSLTDDK